MKKFHSPGMCLAGRLTGRLTGRLLGRLGLRSAGQAAGRQGDRPRTRLKLAAWGLGLMLILHRTGQLHQAAQQPVDGILVLGGSIRREMKAASQAQAHPDWPILISAGSPDPCIWSLFEREPAPKNNTWLEPCARSTLDNYRFSLPILRGWGLRHVQLITSGNHQRRALGLGRIILGSHGIWLSASPAEEVGRPGNRESPLKTGVDWLRGLAWAVVSQVYQPHCPGLIRLDQVDWASWRARSFACEAQGEVELPGLLESAAGEP